MNIRRGARGPLAALGIFPPAKTRALRAYDSFSSRPLEEALRSFQSFSRVSGVAMTTVGVIPRNAAA